MKFSKVGHVRSAVSVTDYGVEGIIYDNPAKEGKYPVQDLEDRFDILNRNAKALYRIFTPAKGKEYYAARTIRKKGEDLVRTLLKVGGRDPLAAQMAYLKSAKMASYGISDASAKLIGSMVQRYLRQSLRREVRKDGKVIRIPDVIKGILSALVLASDEDLSEYLEKIDGLGEEAITVFLETLNEDYNKDIQKKNTVRSLQRQNVKVQPLHKEERFLLRPADADHPKKRYRFDFMTAYAGADEPAKEEMLVRIRQLILLFFCGREAYEEASGKDCGVNARSFGALLPQPEEYFLGKDFHDYYRQIDAYWSEIACYEEEKKEIDGKYKKYNDKKDQLAEIKKKKGKVSRRIDECYEKIRALADQTITDAYRQAVKEDLDRSDIFWIDHLQKDAIRQIGRGKKIPEYKLSARYLCTHAWDAWTAYLSRKYMDLGKVVYHFGMPDLYNMDSDSEVIIGEVKPEYRKGLSTFDYERIKAEENLDRDISTAVSFALNSFSRSICGYERKERHEDVLLLNEVQLKEDLLDDAGKRVLRFFGGMHAWKSNEEISLYASDDKGYELVKPMQQMLYAVRNSAFHYTGKEGPAGYAETALLETMFSQEEEWLGKILRKKYYSNNAHKFYKNSDITRLMEFLYKKQPVRPPQIPSFNRIMNRNSAYQHPKIVEGGSKSRISGGEIKYTEMFKGTLFFLLKEIYYYGFLQEKDVARKFLTFVRDPDNRSAAQNRDAYDNFIKRIDKIGDNADLGQICQTIMTDYEMQNQDKMVKKGNSRDRGSYKHFRTLLYIFIRETFVDYLTKSERADIFAFIGEPVRATTEPGEEEFCSGWTCTMYDGILKEEEKGNMLKWYVTGHFLTPKQLNHLIGSFKTYIWYLRDIERRAADTENLSYPDKAEDKASLAMQILRILEFTMYFCGQTSTHLDDYFSDEEEYAQTLAEVVSFKDEYYPDCRSALKAFCDRDITITLTKGNGKISTEEVQCGIYHDGMNPIVNRNVIMASMYSSIPILGRVTDSITERDIRAYYQKQADNAKYIKTGKCDSKKEQERLREYQNVKNRVEMNDLITFADMTNDLTSQLVSWAYFRERDLMYFQLGYHYIRLYYTDAVPADDHRRVLIGNGIHITDGAVLYQIAAMYSYGLPVYGINKKGEAEIPPRAGNSSAASIRTFVKNYCHESMKDAPTYFDGLFLFEDITAHDDIIGIRDYIDHFKYYSGPDKSILDLYSEMYDRFFDYSLNFKKSVSFILPNILQRYFVTLRTDVEKEAVTNGGNERSCARIKVKNAVSDKLTYKVGEKNVPVLVDARNRVFLESVRRLLEYRTTE